MKILTAILIYIFAFLISCTGQNIKNDFKVNLGALYRITPVPLQNTGGVTIPRHKVFIETDRQLMSGGLVIGMAYLFQKHSLSFQYNQIVRYGYIHSGPISELSTEGVKNTHYGLMTDFQFFLFKDLNSNKENNFVLGVGYSLLNRGTSYTYVERTNSVSLSSYTDNLNFSSFNLSVGYIIKQKLKFELNNYFTNKTNFDDTGKLLLFELKTSCFFDIFKKDSNN